MINFDGVTAGLTTHHSDRNSGCHSRTVSLEGGVAAVTGCVQCPVLASLGVWRGTERRKPGGTIPTLHTAVM